MLPGAIVTIKNVDTGATREVTTNNAGLLHRAVPRHRHLHRHREAERLRHARPRERAGRPQSDAGRRFPAQAGQRGRNGDGRRRIAADQHDQRARSRARSTSSRSSTSRRSIPAASCRSPRSSRAFRTTRRRGQNNPTASSGSSINFNGTGTRGATFQINGVNNDDSSENQNRQGAALSTIKEFQVITQQLQRRVRPRRTAPSCSSRPSRARTVARRRLRVRPGQQRPDGAAEVRAASSPTTSGISTAAPSAFRSRQNRLFGFASFDRTKSGAARTTSRATCSRRPSSPRRG